MTDNDKHSSSFHSCYQFPIIISVRHFHPSRIFAGKAGANPSGALTGLHCKGRLLALSARVKVPEIDKDSSFFRAKSIAYLNKLERLSP